MADPKQRNDPLLAFRFNVKFDDLDAGGFSDCTGLQLETEVHEFAEGGRNDAIHKFPTRTKQSNITLKRGIVDRKLHDWYTDLVEAKVVLKNCTIVLLDSAGDPSAVVAKWTLRGAFPCKWIGPSFEASKASVAVETFELCYDTLKREK